MYIIIWKHLDDIPYCFNTILHFPIWQESRKKPLKCGNYFKILEHVAVFISPIVAFDAVGFTGLYFKTWKNSRYLYSLVPDSFKNGILFLLFLVYELFTSFVGTYIWQFCFILTITFLTKILVALRELADVSMMKKKKSLADWLVTLSKTLVNIRHYKALQILNTYAHCEFVETLCVNLLFSVMFYHGIFIYMTVKLHDAMPPLSVSVFAFWAVVGLPALEAIVLLKMAQVYETSNEILQNWRSQLRSRERRWVRLRPLGVRFAGTIKKTTPLLVIVIICKTAKYLLIVS
ncbi:unnamed protein product [Allacma fusca]|uniref:Uncharacterized protein n=1 Tax=Allacma fusca TaxID=39272 RepID=A0A8J2KMD1_9HEXA|nr:unnamed protein product [Allacma fusca]